MANTNQEPTSVITMPKSKPTQVIVHRIELQEKERDALEAIVAGQVTKNIVQPVVLSSAVVAGSYLGYKALKSAYQWGEDIVDKAQDDFKEWSNDPKRQVAFATAETLYKTNPNLTGLRGVGNIVKWFIS